MKTNAFRPLFGGVLLMLAHFTTSALARTSIDLDFDWRFAKGDFGSAMMLVFNDSAWRTVKLPHDWSIEGPFGPEYGSGNGYAQGGVAWYRRHLTIDAANKGKNVAIEFDGVYENSKVYINGFVVGGRPYGYSSFQCDLTPYIKFGADDNVIAVRVDHSRFADSRWYSGSGIYRNVRLRITDKLHVAPSGIYVTTPAVMDGSATIRVETVIENRADQARQFTLSSEVVGPDLRTVGSATSSGTADSSGHQTIIQQITIDRPQLWSIESPILYAVKSRLNSSSADLDELSTPFGIRTIQFDADKGFSLNGKTLKLKGVCIHHDAGCLGSAVPEKVLERRLVLLKELGVNAIRTSHNPPAPELLDLCDRLGLLVKDEAIDEFTPAKNKWISGWNVGVPGHWGYADLFDQWAIIDVQDMVRRDRNHPSIILWSIGNEVDYANDPFSHPILGNNYRPQNPPAEDLTRLGKPLVAAIKALDTTRPVAAALANLPMSDAVGFADILDVVGYNYQESLYAEHHQKYPKRIIFGSENSHQYRDWVATRDNDFVAGQFLWTGIDYLGEAHAWPNRGSDFGLLDTCGFKKPMAWFRQSLWSDKPMVYLCTSTGRRGALAETWNYPAGASVTITCYTNCPSVELSLNGKPIGAKRLADATDGALTWTIPYEVGVLKATATNVNGTKCDYTLSTAGPADRIELIADQTQLHVDAKDVSHLEFRICDANGVRVPDALNEVKFEITGPSQLLGIDNGNMSGPEDYRSPQRAASHGRGLAILQSTTTPGKTTVTVTSPGLKSAAIDLSSR